MSELEKSITEKNDMDDSGRTIDSSNREKDTERSASSDAAEKENEIVTPAILNLDYRYIKLLGEGANGRTWLARDRRNALNVAIKELKFVEDFKTFELFQREAEVLQSIRVRGVPRCYANITKDLTSYIIQEYIPYPSLESMIDAGEIFEEDEVYSILDMVSEILFALETQYIPAIVHRDIKPGNILYQKATRTQEARVWLIDFGAVDNAHKQSSGSTIAGTFGYCAPEQLQGEVSVKSDYYALGATALHLLTGVFPWEIPNEVFQLKFHPVIEEKAPNTTKPMIELLDTLLASNPEHRPEDIRALRRAIQEARESSRKYREIAMDIDEVLDLPARTRPGRWFRNTKVGTKLHNVHLSFLRKKAEWKRARRIKKLEREEARARKRREAEARRLAEERAKSGILCECAIRRVSVMSFDDIPVGDAWKHAHFKQKRMLSGSLDFNALEGIFCYEGDWHPAYLTEPAPSSISINCTTTLAPNQKVHENTFQVHFLPEKCDIALAEPQTVWLTPDLYTRFTGRMAPGKD